MTVAERCGVSKPNFVRHAAGGGQGIALAHLVADTHPVVVFAHRAVHQPSAGARRNFPFQRQAPGGDVAPVDVVIDAGQSVPGGVGLTVGEVLDVAVAPHLEAGHARGEAAAEGNVDGAGGAPVVVGAVFQVQIAVPGFENRPAGDQVDRAAGGVAGRTACLGGRAGFPPAAHRRTPSCSGSR